MLYSYGSLQPYTAFYSLLQPFYSLFYRLLQPPTAILQPSAAFYNLLQHELNTSPSSFFLLPPGRRQQ